MRTSERRTTVATLRAFISDCVHPRKITALDFADMFGCGVDTIRSAESGRLSLSESLALRIAHETGVSVSWLLSGKPDAPPTDPFGRCYTRETFERARSKKYERFGRHELSLRGLEYYSIIRSLLRMASGKGEAQLVAYKLWTGIRDVARELGAPEEVQIQNKETFEEHIRRIAEEDINSAIKGLVVYSGVSQHRARPRPKRTKRSSA